MTALRQQMEDAMVLRGFALRTRETYLACVKGLATYYHRSPERLDAAQIQAYLLHLITERKLAYASVNQAACATLRARTVLMTTYAAGLRVSEVCALQVGDIESAPDRMCPLLGATLASPALLRRIHRGGGDDETISPSMRCIGWLSNGACS